MPMLVSNLLGHHNDGEVLLSCCDALFRFRRSDATCPALKALKICVLRKMNNDEDNSAFPGISSLPLCSICACAAFFDGLTGRNPLAEKRFLKTLTILLLFHPYLLVSIRSWGDIENALANNDFAG